MKESVPAEFSSHNRPINIHERLSELNKLLRMSEAGNSDLVYRLYNELRALDEVSGLVDKDLIFSGEGVLVSFEEGEPLDPQDFDIDQTIGTCLGFDIWFNEASASQQVYLSIRTDSLSYADDGEIESGSIYYLDPFASTIRVIEGSFNDIVTELDEIANSHESESSFGKILSLVDRYERMVKSRKFKKLDEAAKAQAIDTLLGRLNNRLDALGVTVNVSGGRIYLRDSQNGQYVPRMAASSLVRGEPAAFVSLHAVMPELCPELRSDQLCLALVPDNDTARYIQATSSQIVFVPITTKSDIIVETTVSSYDDTV